MNLLLDTHSFLWWDGEPEKLSVSARTACEDDDNTLFLSLVSIWEMQIKHQLGNLALRLPLPELIQEQQETNGLKLLPVSIEHIYQLSALPPHHRDPFDRLLIAQAQVEDFAIVTVDTMMPLYDVRIVG